MKKKDDALAGYLGCFGIIVVAGIIFGLMWLSSDKSEPSPGSEKTMAHIMSQGFVKKRLKSPGSAEFPSMAWDKTDIRISFDRSTGLYTVRAWVDAQNSFGAKIRTNYIVVLKEARPDNWTAKKV